MTASFQSIFKTIIRNSSIHLTPYILPTENILNNPRRSISSVPGMICMPLLSHSFWFHQTDATPHAMLSDVLPIRILQILTLWFSILVNTGTYVCVTLAYSHSYGLKNNYRTCLPLWYLLQKVSKPSTNVAAVARVLFGTIMRINETKNKFQNWFDATVLFLEK
jgi:hypothetical protein